VSAAPTIRDRLLAFELQLDRATCDEVRATGWGTTFLTPSLPEVWDASWIALKRPGLGKEALALVDEALADFGHRTVVPLGEADGRRLAAELGRLPGWKAERVLYMTWAPEQLRRSSFSGDMPGKGRTPDANARARETALAEILPLRRQIHRELLPPGVAEPDRVVEELIELDRRYATVAGDRWFVAPAEREPAAACKLLAGEGIRQVEDVATLKAQRGRGLAQAVVGAAIDAARAEEPELIYLTADADDWPRLMYGKLGFRAVGELTVLRRNPL
jgi:GNAT superfamily N-acetyltransferase